MSGDQSNRGHKVYLVKDCDSYRPKYTTSLAVALEGYELGYCTYPVAIAELETAEQARATARSMEKQDQELHDEAESFR